MLKRIITLFICCIMGVAIFAPHEVRADADLTVLRIAATLALEVGGSPQHQESLDMVAAVIQERYTQQNKAYKTKTTWADVLYGNNAFEHSRGFASKTAEELKTYIRNKSGSAWANVMAAAKKVYSHTANTAMITKSYRGKTYVINGFMMNFSGREKKDDRGNIIQTGLIYKTPDLHVDFFWASLGKITAYGNYVKFDEDAPMQSHKYDNAIVDQYITGKYARNKNGGDVNVGDVQEGGPVGYEGNNGGTSGGSSGGRSRSRPTYEKPEGYDDRGLCALDVMSDLYLNSDVEESKACWYCNVVVVLANAYLKAAAGALPSAITLGEMILKFGFLIWLAYYILQQVSSFTPITPSKVLQEILVMGFKVALAYLAVKYAESLIIEYYVNPIGELGTQYGGAMFDKLYPANAVQ